MISHAVIPFLSEIILMRYLCTDTSDVHLFWEVLW